MTIRPPQIEALERLQAFVGLDMRDIAQIEIASADLTSNPSADTIQMAAMTPPHFDIVHEMAESKQILAMPRYFKRAVHGIHLHPRPDKPYWLRVTYRPPVKYEARDPG